MPNLVISGVPGFASGVENYTGWAVVGENGPELANFNGGSVYPLSTGSSASDASPISLGGGGGGVSAPQSINLVVQLDSQALVQAMGLPLSQSIRVGMGLRGF